MNENPMSLCFDVVEMCQRRMDQVQAEYGIDPRNIVNGALPHAGGASYKGKATTVSVDASIECTSTDGGAVVAADDDDDGDGDGDPDSDRAPLKKSKFQYTETLQTALSKKRATTSNRILRMAELKIRVGLSRSTIYEFIKSGQMPRSISLGSRAVGWLESDIDAWLESRISFSNSI